MGIFTGFIQDHLGCVSMERPESVGLLPGVRPENRDVKQLFRCLSGDGGGAGSLVGVEGGGLEIFGGHHGRCGVQLPAYRLCGTA